MRQCDIKVIFWENFLSRTLRLDDCCNQSKYGSTRLSLIKATSYKDSRIFFVDFLDFGKLLVPNFFGKDVMTLFFPMFPFDPPENIRTKCFPDVFRGIKTKHWEGKGWWVLLYLRKIVSEYNFNPLMPGGKNIYFLLSPPA